MNENQKLALSTINFLSSKGWKDENIEKHLSNILFDLKVYDISIVVYFECFISNCLNNRI